MYLLSRSHVGICVSGVVVLWLLLSCSFSSGDESDINCLRSIKDSLEDPLGYLNSSWDFSNVNTEGFICNFMGIECWYPYDQSKVLNIKLSGLGLNGPFPRGIGNCTSLKGLDLSSNMLHGSLPDDIGRIIWCVSTLDLSSNNFSGPIPSSLGHCSSLNVLKLENNQFEGTIPEELGQLHRITTFSVANNHLTGQVPDFGGNPSIQANNYANNPGLCGEPLLKKCKSSAKTLVRVLKSNSVLMFAALGFGIGFAISFAISFTFFVNSNISQYALDRILRITYCT